MKRFLSILAIVVLVSGALLVSIASDALAQRSDRAVRVQGRQATANEQRVALVIGNHAYTRIASLRNPGNDARDMAAALRKTGFRVTLLLNATRGQMGEAIAGFEDAVSKGGVGLFFYAGHGVQVGGVNYLIPIGANITRQSQVEFEAISANRVMASMEAAGNRLNMVFLDACRNNPFKGNRFRAIGGGLAAVRNAPKGSLISYATGAGGVAADGAGRNGTYTKNLLRYIGQPGLELTTMMKRVRSGVQRDTRDRQTPYELSSLTGDFYFT
ncbi:MAG: caspase family protein, partial [bacterium]